MIALSKRFSGLQKDRGKLVAPTAPWRRLPRLIALIDDNFNLRYFRVRISFAGKIRLTPQADEGGFRKSEAVIVCVSPQHIFKRRLQSGADGRNEIKRVMPGLFPFPAEDTYYALYSESGDGANSYAAALRPEDLARIADKVRSPLAAIIVADPTEQGVLKALEERIKLGPVVDFLPNPQRFISPSISLALMLTVALAGLIILGQLALSYERAYLQQSLVKEVEGLSTEGTELESRYKALSKMQGALEAYKQFQESSGSASFQTLMKAMDTLPQGVSIDRIEMKNGRITISGLGKDTQKWLQSLGVNANDVVITPLPQFDRYVAPLP